MRPNRRWRPRDAAVPVVLAAVFLAAFGTVLLGERSFFHFDLYAEHVPVWHAVQSALLAGESPFWIDGQYAGNPFLYVQEAPLFYPLTVPLLLTGAAAHRLADLFSLAHFLLAGFLAARLVREETGDDGAAAVGGVAWMLSARTVQCALWPNAVAVAALVPGLLLGLLRIARGERRSGVLLAALFGGLLGLTSRPQAVVGFLPAVIACGVLVLRRAPGRRAAARDLAFAFVVACAMAAPSVLPTAILHPEMERATGLTRAERDEGALEAETLRSVFLPAGPAAGSPEAVSHPGFAAWPLVAAAIVVGRGRRDLLAALGAAGLAGLAFAFGESGPWGLLSGLPLLSSLRAPSRFLLSWSLFLAIGAALGAAALARRYPRARLLVPAAVLLLGADLAIDARRAAPTASAEVYELVPRLSRALKDRPPDRSGFPPRHWSAGTRLPDARAPYATLALFDEGARLPGASGIRWGLEAFEGDGPALARTRRLVKWGFPRAARAVAADTVVTRDSVLRVSDPLPRAFVVPDAMVASADDAFRVLLSPRFDPARVVLIEPGAAPSSGGWTPGTASVRLLERRPGRLRLQSDSPGPGWLVLLDSFEKGWSATVDGAAAPLLPANVAFRAVPLPAGRHEVEMRYRARGVLSGLAIAALGLALLLLRARSLPSARESPR